MSSVPVIAIAMGDHAGIGPEITVKMLAELDSSYIPIVVGDENVLRTECLNYAPSATEKLVALEKGAKPSSLNCIYYVNVPKGPAVQHGVINKESGDHSFEQMRVCCRLCKEHIADGFILAPVTKKALNLSIPQFTNEMDLLEEEFGVKGVRPVVRAGSITRCSVVSHVRFRDILANITIETVVDAGMDLYKVLKRLGQPDARVAMAAINPHGGDGGVFGDEEIVILAPAAEELRKKGLNISGPFPADTVFSRALSGNFESVLFMFHDQGNIAGKLAQFSDGVVIYSKVPYPIVTAAHGSATDIAGKGIAKPDNMRHCLHWVIEMIKNS